jgi:hypothetical protein
MKHFELIALTESIEVRDLLQGSERKTPSEKVRQETLLQRFQLCCEVSGNLTFSALLSAQSTTLSIGGHTQLQSTVQMCQSGSS